MEQIIIILEDLKAIKEKELNRDKADVLYKWCEGNEAEVKNRILENRILILKFEKAINILKGNK